MVSLLSKIFIKNRDDVTDPAVRKAYGSLCSALGIVLNVLLFAGKYIAGAVSGLYRHNRRCVQQLIRRRLVGDIARGLSFIQQKAGP